MLRDLMLSTVHIILVLCACCGVLVVLTYVVARTSSSRSSMKDKSQ